MIRGEMVSSGNWVEGAGGGAVGGPLFTCNEVVVAL